MQADAPPDATHTYRLPLRSPRYRASLVFRLVGACVLGIGIVVVRHSPEIIVSAMAVFVINLFRDARSDTHIMLTLSPEGIAYQIPTRTITANWQDVERVGCLHGLYGLLWRRIGEGLWLTGYRVTDGSPTRWMFADAFVPLAWFDQDWRTGALGDAIQQYAPWLMEEH